MVEGDLEPGTLGHEMDDAAVSKTMDVSAGVLAAVAAWTDGLGSGSGDQPLTAMIYGQTEDVAGPVQLTQSDPVVIVDGAAQQLTTFVLQGGVRWIGGPLSVQLVGAAPLLSARAFGALGDGDVFEPSVFVTTSVPFATPLLAEEELAAYGWETAQLMLAGAVESRTQRLVSAEWHHTSLDDREGAFALVREGGPLEDLVGDVVLVSTGGRSAFVYVAGMTDDMDEDLSLARRAFAALGNLSADRLMVTVGVTHAPAS